MEYELERKLKKGDIKAFRELYSSEIKRAWFLCCEITEDASKAAELLVRSVLKVTENTLNSVYLAEDNFKELLYSEVYHTSEWESEVEEKEELKLPKIPMEYKVFSEAIQSLNYDERRLYLLTEFIGITPKTLSRLCDLDLSQISRSADELSLRVQEFEKIKEMRFKDKVLYFTQFKSPAGKIYKEILVPSLVTEELDKGYASLMKQRGKEIVIKKAKSKKNNKKLSIRNKKSRKEEK